MIVLLLLLCVWPLCCGLLVCAVVRSWQVCLVLISLLFHHLCILVCVLWPYSLWLCPMTFVIVLPCGKLVVLSPSWPAPLELLCSPFALADITAFSFSLSLVHMNPWPSWLTFTFCHAWQADYFLLWAFHSLCACHSELLSGLLLLPAWPSSQTHSLPFDITGTLAGGGDRRPDILLQHSRPDRPSYLACFPMSHMCPTPHAWMGGWVGWGMDPSCTFSAFLLLLHCVLVCSLFCQPLCPL